MHLLLPLVSFFVMCRCSSPLGPCSQITQAPVLAASCLGSGSMRIWSPESPVYHRSKS